MNTGTMAMVALCPLSNTCSGACAKWNDELAQPVALPSPGVQILLVTQCRGRLSSNFKAGKCLGTSPAGLLWPNEAEMSWS